jgi:transposase InsO family protein
MSLQNPALDAYLKRRPVAGNADEEMLDKKCLAFLTLYVEDCLTEIIDNAQTANEAYVALYTELLAALQIRKTVNNQQISQFTQNSQSVEEYLMSAQKLMSEARDVDVQAHMEQLCSQVIYGLRPDIKKSIGDSMLAIIEENIEADATAEQVQTVFNLIVQRIRTRCTMLFPEVSLKIPGEDEAAMFNVQQHHSNISAPHHQVLPPTAHPRQPHQQPPDMKMLDHSGIKCHLCGNFGHIRRNCALLKQQQGTWQQPHQPMFGRQGSPPVNNQTRNVRITQNGNQQQPVVPQAPIQIPTQRQVAFQVRDPSQDDIARRIEELQRQLDRMTRPSTEGQGRHYSIQAVVNSVQRRGNGLTVLYLDGGSTHHCVRDKAMLYNRTASPVSKVLVAGGEEHAVACEGSMLIETPTGQETFHKVLCVPTFVVNLLSTPQLDAQGYTVMHTGGHASISDSSDNQIMHGQLINGLYKLDCTIRKNEPSYTGPLSFSDHYGKVHIAAPSPDESLMHRRLGHPGIKATRGFLNGNIALGLLHTNSKNQDDYCEVCKNSREPRAHFGHCTRPATRPLERVHSDIMGPFKCASLGGHKYTVTLYDQFSGYGEVFLLTKKSETDDALREAIYRWQRQTQKKILCIRTDRGKEYEGNFQRFLRTEGIVHERSAAYTPEQNGVAERYNRTLVEKTRCLLDEHKSPTFLWGDAIKTASHIRNLLPKTGQVLSPYELMFDVKPSADHLRIFGCTAHVYIPPHQREKLEPSSSIGIFVGYATHSKAWRVLVWRDKQFKVVESASVVFAENMSPSLHSLKESPHDAPEEPDSNINEDDDDELFAYGLVPLSTTHPVRQQIDPDVDGNVSIASNAAEETQPEDPADDSMSEPDDAENVVDWAIDSNGEVNPAAADMNDEEGSLHGRWPGRIRKQPDRLVFKVAAVPSTGDFDNPRSIQEALRREDRDLWIEAINKELRSLFEKNVYLECSLPASKKALTTKFVLHIKRDVYGNIEKYKARLVARGFQQQEGVDFDDIFAPTAQSASFRVLCSIAAQQQLDIQQIDVSTAFLNGELHDEVYVRPPACLGISTKVWKLQRALYGLRQAAKAWNDKLVAVLKTLGFTQSDGDPCLFLKGKHRGIVYLLVHVDDAILVGQPHHVACAKKDIADSFTITDLGEARQFLSIEIIRTPSGILLTQKEYCRELLKKHFGESAENIVASKPTPMATGTILQKEGSEMPEENPFRAIIGALLYLACNTRPDISHAVGCLSRFLNDPTVQHMVAAKRVLRYLSGTTDMGLFFEYKSINHATSWWPPYIRWDDDHLAPEYESSTHTDVHGVESFFPQVPPLHVYGDADFSMQPDTRKSTTGMLVLWNGHPISWLSKLQPIVSTSTTEAEFIAAATAAKEGLWLRKLLASPLRQARQFHLFCDNSAAVSLIKNATAGVSNRTKHIDVQYMFVRERQKCGDLRVQQVSTSDMYADIFTKPLSKTDFQTFRHLIGMRSLAHVTEK